MLLLLGYLVPQKGFQISVVVRDNWSRL